MKPFLSLITILLILQIQNTAQKAIEDPENTYPVLFFHGLNDYCRFDIFKYQIQAAVKVKNNHGNEIHGECLEIGPQSPKQTSLFMEMKKQAEAYCKLVQKHPVFNSTNFNIVAMSQGNFFARYIIQHCDLGKYKVHNYLSLGGPHLGIQKYPKCKSGFWCWYFNSVAENIIYCPLFYPYFQSYISPAEYFRDSTDESYYNYYLNNNRFLPYLNNEKQHALYDQYKERFSSLNRIMLVAFGADSVLYPRETAMFQEVGVAGELVEFNQTKLYTNDSIGLKTLYEQGKVTKFEIPGKDHLDWTQEMQQNVFIPFLYAKDKQIKQKSQKINVKSDNWIKHRLNIVF